MVILGQLLLSFQSGNDVFDAIKYQDMVILTRPNHKSIIVKYDVFMKTLPLILESDKVTILEIEYDLISHLRPVETSKLGQLKKIIMEIDPNLI